MEMIELTDADRDAINAERVRVFVDLPAWERRYVNWDETLYRAGLAAGIERAAKRMEPESTNTAITIRALDK